MTNRPTLIVTSSLSILFMAVHLADDIARGFEPGKLATYNGVLLLAVWLYATLMLAERRLAHAIVLLFSICGAGVPVLHMRGVGLVGGRIASSSGVLFWVWTLIALGVTSLVSVILSGRGLWRLQRDRSRSR